MGNKYSFRNGIVTARCLKGIGTDDQVETSSISYSGGKAPAASRVFLETSTISQVIGSQVWVTANGEPTEDGTSKGFCAFRASIDATNAMTFENSAIQGSIYGGIFIAKASNASANFGSYHPLIGLEGWAYPSTTGGKVKTMIGGNFGYHSDSTADQGSGSVWRGVQIFCDDTGPAAAVTEQTGLCLWNQAGTQTNAIKVVQSGSGFTNLLAFYAVSAPLSASSSGTFTKTHKIAVDVAGSTAYIQVGTIA